MIARRRRAQSGNSILELALIIVPFLAITLSIMELALPIFKKSTFEHAVREGCRFGITFDTTYNGNTYGSQTAAIKAVVEANSMGFLNATNANLINVQYYNSATFAQVTGPGANADGNVLQVSISGYTHSWIAPVQWAFGSIRFGLSTTPLAINAVSADRLESLNPGTARPAP